MPLKSPGGYQFKSRYNMSVDLTSKCNSLSQLCSILAKMDPMLLYDNNLEDNELVAHGLMKIARLSCLIMNLSLSEHSHLI